MSIFSVANNEHLIRTQLWTKQLKELLLDDLFAMRFVKTITDFPDGTTLNIPSIGEAETSDYAEGAAIKYNKMDTGNFQFEFDQYKYSANALTEQFKQDSYWSSEVVAMFPQRQHRAIMEGVEARIFDRANAGQTSGQLNTINGADHRFIGEGAISGGPSNLITLDTFAKARYALTKANVPLQNLVAVVDPSVTYRIETQTNVTNLLSPMPRWGDMLNGGLKTGFMFRFNIFGFDVYESNYLPDNISETIGGTTVTNGVANLFFSATPGDTLPIVGAFRQMPTVYSDFNKDLQQWEYMTVTRYGFKLYRPENMVVCLTNKTIA